MSCKRFVSQILEIADPSSLTVFGDSYSLSLVSDAHPDSLQDFAVFLRATQAGGVTNPTVDLILETSPDGIVWAEVKRVSLTSDGAKAELHNVDLGPFVKASLRLDGDTNPISVASAWILSDGPFKAIKVS